MVTRLEESTGTPLFVSFQIPALKIERRLAFVFQPSFHKEVLAEIRRCMEDMQANLGPALTLDPTKQINDQLASLDFCVVRSFTKWQECVEDWKEAAFKHIRKLQKEVRDLKEQLHENEQYLQGVHSKASTTYPGDESHDGNETYMPDPLTQTRMMSKTATSTKDSLPPASDKYRLEPTQSVSSTSSVDGSGVGPVPVRPVLPLRPGQLPHAGVPH